MKAAIQRAQEAEERTRAKQDSLLNETVIEIDETEIEEEEEQEGGQQ